MATYYKYAERNAESRINWAEVGKDMTEMVREETRIRQEKKNAIDKQAREEFDRLSNPPMGEHQGFNEFTTKFAGDTQEYSLMVENLVKSGQMNLRDYTNIRANLSQGTGEAFSVSEEYNAQYEEFLKRQEIDPVTGLPSAQAYEEFVMGTAQGFGNYSNHELFISPTDGRVNLGKIDPTTGKVNKEIGSYIPVNQLRNRVKSKYDVYNLDVSSKGMVDQLGQIIDVEMRGGVKTREDARNGDNFQDALDNFVASQLEIPTNVSSILTNTLGTNPDTGNPYRFTDDPAEAAANPDFILSIVNPMQPDSGVPMPAFGVDMDEVLKDAAKTNANPDGLSAEQIAAVKKNNEGQLRAATEAMKTSVLSKVDVIETPQAEFNNEKDRAERGRGVRQTEQAVTNIADIYYGDQSELDAALGFVQGLDPSVSRVYIDPENPDNVLIERKDKKGNIVVLEPFVKGDNVEDFVKSVVTTLVPDAVDIEKALANSGIRNEDRTKTNFVGAAGESRTPVAPTIPTFDEKLDDEDEFSDTPSDVHQTAFEGANNHTEQANAETEFFSKVGITNAEVRAIDENEIDDYIVGGNINDNSVTEIFIPGVMSMPILIPDGNTSAEFEAINRFILNHIRNGGAPLTPNDFKELDIDEFSQYNNEKMSDGFLGLQWNDGLGPQPMSNENAKVVRTQPASTINTSGY